MSKRKAHVPPLTGEAEENAKAWRKAYIHIDMNCYVRTPEEEAVLLAKGEDELLRELREEIAELKAAPPPAIFGSTPAARKSCPIYTGCVDYFPNALALVARLSYLGNEQHNPGTKVHWDRAKSSDNTDAGMRHAIEGDKVAAAWRALADLQAAFEDGYRPEWFTEEMQ